MINKTALALICTLLVQINVAISVAAETITTTPPASNFHSSSAGQVITLAQQIAVLEKFLQKKLVGIESLEGVIPSAWLAENFSTKKERRVAEEQLTQLLSQQAAASLSADRRAELKESILLWQLKLQWLKYSAPQRKQLVMEAQAKALALRTQVQAEAAMTQAEEVTRESNHNKQAISGAIERSQSARETQLLESQLALEDAMGEIGLQLRQLAQAKKIFARDIEEWRHESAKLSGLSTPANAQADFTRARYLQRNEIRALLRKLLYSSNDRLWSQADFFAHYQGINENDWNPTISLSSLQIEEQDSEQVQALIFALQEKHLVLIARAKELKQERENLLHEVLRWNQQQRDELLTLRGVVIGQFIEEGAYQLGNTEPLWLEIKTLATRTSFALWSMQYGWWRESSNGVFAVSNLAHLINLLLLLFFTTILLIKKAPLLASLRKRLNSRAQTETTRRLLTLGFDLFRYFYVFLVLILMGKLVIDFIASLGFSPILELLPIYDHLVLFFLMSGALNYFVPLLSLRSSNALSDKTQAIEGALTLLPKVLLYYWLVAGLVELALFKILNVNLLQLYLITLLRLGCFVAVYIAIARHIQQWRLIGVPIVKEGRWAKLIVESHNRWWEPLVLLVSGGLGVYRVLWDLISARLSELDMTRSLQATLSRAILERQKPRLLLHETLNEMPADYRDLFDYRQRIAGDAYVKRPEQDEQLQAVYREWKSTGIGARVIISGDRGIGKSALINHFLEQLDNAEIRQLHLNPAMANMELLQTYLNKSFPLVDGSESDKLSERIDQLPPSIIVAENIENLLLRKIGGFEAITLLIDIILHTSARHLWVVSCNSYSWTIAKQGVRGIDCFTDAIEMEGMSEEEIAHMVMERHGLAHTRKPDFTQLQFSAKSKKYVHSAEGNQKAQQLYFRILWSYTRGNPRHALYHWKNSLVWEKDQVVVQLFAVPQQKILERLQDGSLMLLAALIEHNGLTLTGLGEVMNTTETIALRRIEEISSYSMVYAVEDADGESWHVDSFWFKSVENYLVKRQFLFHGGQL